MSKHLGNVLEPIALMDAARRRRGALVHGRRRLARGRPGGSGTRPLEEVVRKVLLTYWNTASFQSLYARANGWSPGRDAGAAGRADRPLLDRWALSEPHRTVARRRRGARGLRHPAGRPAADAASSTTCPTGTSAAPAAGSGTATRPRSRPCTSASRSSPGCWRRSRRSSPSGSGRTWSRDLDRTRRTRCTSRPGRRVDAAVDRRRLAEQMALVRRLVELGRAARAESGVKTRQPLARALVSAPGWAALPDELRRPGRRGAQRAVASTR